jgi:hypothetical protein
MLAKFRHRYPQGSLVSELVEIDRGTYIVKALVQVDNIVLATALAGADTVEAAEDAAKERAIATLFLDSHLASIPASPPEASVNPSLEQKVSEPTEPTKIANFSQPKSKVSPSISVVEDPLPAPSIPQVLEPQLNPEPELKDPAAAANNLFGDTFTAEIPATASIPDNNSNNSLHSNSAAELDAMDFHEIKQKTDIEIRRLGWSKDQGMEFLMSHYGKRSRLHLTDEQLLEFLRYLEKLPSSVV